MNSNLGRHCCLWCTITYSQIQKSPEKLREERRKAKQPEETPLRDLEMLKVDYNKLQVECGGDISKAKEYNNVIMPYLLDIPLDMVSYTQTQTLTFTLLQIRCAYQVSTFPSAYTTVCGNF